MTRQVKQKISDQLHFLLARKSRIEQLLADEMSNRAPCTWTLRHLKKLKLSIKDRIVRLSSNCDQRSFG